MLNVCEKEKFPCFLYLIQIFVPNIDCKIVHQIAPKIVSVKVPETVPALVLTGQQNRLLISPDFFLEIVSDLKTVPKIVYGIVSKVVPKIEHKIAPKIIP